MSEAEFSPLRRCLIDLTCSAWRWDGSQASGPETCRPASIDQATSDSENNSFSSVSNSLSE